MPIDSIIDTIMRKDSSLVSLKLVNCIFLSVSLIVAGLRLWVRFVMLKAGGLDDLLLIVAILFTVSLSIASLVGEDLGLGNHIWQLSLAEPVEKLRATSDITKTLYACYLTSPTAIAFTKLSIMATYYRIFPPGSLRKITVTLSIIASIFWVASIFAVVFTCIPVQAAWDYSVKGHCYNTLNFFMISSSFHIILDIMLCVLPIPFIWSLSIPKTQRLILLALFCGGALACVSSILRLIHLRRAGDNVNTNTVDAIAWSIIEVDTGIICASVAALRPLCRFLTLPNTSGEAKNSDRSNENDISKNNRNINDQKSWLDCTSTHEIMSLTSTLGKHEEIKNSAQTLKAEKYGSLTLEPSPRPTRDKSAECTVNALIHQNHDHIFITNSGRSQDKLRRKTWNLSESTPIVPSESLPCRTVFPIRSKSVYDFDCMNQIQVNHPRAIKIAESRCGQSHSVLRPLQNRNSFATSSTQTATSGSNLSPYSRDKKIQMDEFLFKHSEEGLAPNPREEKITQPAFPYMPNVPEDRHTICSPHNGLPRGFSCEISEAKLRREIMCFSKS